MKLFVPFSCLVFTFFFVDRTYGQSDEKSLTEQLASENPAKLVEMSRKTGDIVRGAILFHQGNINCVKCHRPTSESKRIGPDLSRLSPDVSDESIVESILYPSKVIAKGYETVTVLRMDGILVNGQVVEQDSEKIVLRDAADINQVITIKQADVDEVRPGKLSTMPEELVNELENRKHFLDLLRYVLDVRERGPANQNAMTTFAGKRQLSPVLEGVRLIQELNCAACHESNVAQTGVSPKTSPHLSWSRERLNPSYLARFIADPGRLKPGTTMPNMLEHLGDQEKIESANAIVHFLQSGVDNRFQKQQNDVQDITRGHELFNSVGCVACHAPRDVSSREISIDDSIPLGELSEKYDFSALVDFLENPHIVRPSGRMPDMQLAHQEAIDIAGYLLQNSANNVAQWNTDAALAVKGKSLFNDLGCASCHTQLGVKSDRRNRPPALKESRLDQGCLSAKIGNWPNFHLGQDQINSIQTALEQPAIQLTTAEKISFALKTFNCIACHSRGELGGVTLERDSYFHSTNMNLGDQGRLPPSLNGVGAKLNPKWMRDVLVNGRVVRPYMKTRMPQYGEANVGHLVQLTQEIDQVAAGKQVSFTDQKEMRKIGLSLAGHKGLNCVACHTYKYKLSDTMPAIDLTEMAERLKKDWFYQYMLAPQDFSPNTVMPSFWPGGEAMRKDLEGDPPFQIEALWQYLIDGRQMGTPSGIVRKPLEIVVGSEAQMLRRSYPGIGKRGIGVGYTGGVNLAWDAEQMRLAMVWQGKFADPGGVWNGQGSGRVRPMGRAINFPIGPDLDNTSNPWIVDDGRPPEHQFRGYALDNRRRPTFRYQFENVEVEDFFKESKESTTDRTSLRRTVSLVTPDEHKDLRFRVAGGKDIKADGEGSYLVEDDLQIRILSDHSIQLSETNGEKLLEIRFELSPSQKQELSLEYSWKK